MSNKPKGGRGNTAPYETKLARIPLPLADQISQLIERYQDFLAQGGEALSPPPLLDAIADYKPVNELDELDNLRRLVTAQEEELSSLHALNGDLNLQTQELQQQLAEAAKGVNNLVKPVNNLSQEPVNNLSQEPVNNLKEPVNSLDPLKAVELGQRLGYRDHSYVGRAKSKPDFTDWSRGKDPDGLGWRYDANSKLFYPVD